MPRLSSTALPFLLLVSAPVRATQPATGGAPTPEAGSGPESPLSAEQYDQLSSDELLDMSFTTASKTDTTVARAASVVEIITREQIRNRGYRYLADALNDIADNHQDRSNWGIGEPVYQNVGFGFRFDTGQNILLLFNGQRLNAFLPGNRFGGEEYLLDNVDRIEIVRGPGSALYGANAFTAVVNIITKQRLAAGTTSHVDVRLGGVAPSWGGGIEGSGEIAVGEEGIFTAAARYERDPGQRILVENDLFGDRYIHDRVQHAFSANAALALGNVRAYLTSTIQERGTFTGFNSVNPTTNDHLRLTYYAHSLGADTDIPLADALVLKARGGVHADNWTEVALIPLFLVNDAGDALVTDANGLPILHPVTVRRDGRDVTTPFLIDGQGADTLTLDAELQLTLTPQGVAAHGGRETPGRWAARTTRSAR